MIAIAMCIGMAKMYYLTKAGQYGTLYKIVPETTGSDHYNVMTCFAIHGMSSAPLSVQSVLPDLSQYTVRNSYMYILWKIELYLFFSLL